MEQHYVINFTVIAINYGANSYQDIRNLTSSDVSVCVTYHSIDAPSYGVAKQISYLTSHR